MTSDKSAMLRELTAEEVSHVSSGLLIIGHIPINHPLPPTPIGHEPVINPPWGPKLPKFPHFPIPMPE